jgi:hypothetical protein
LGSLDGVRFHRDGTYVFPGGSALLKVAGRIGQYWEPNVWMRHEVISGDWTGRTRDRS